MEVDLESGRVLALVVPGRLRFFGLLGREPDRIFPWESVKRFGADIILEDTVSSLFSLFRHTPCRPCLP